MKVKKIRVIHCPFCGQGQNIIESEYDEAQEFYTCPKCNKKFNLKELGLI